MKLLICIELFDGVHTYAKISLNKCVFTKKLHSYDGGDHKSAVSATPVEVSAYFLHPLHRAVSKSPTYRKKILERHWRDAGCPRCADVSILLRLRPPDKEIIDYLWNDRMLRFIWYHVEVENALFWLSTLGGAFSALGDYFEHCAEVAGRISRQQLILSMKLGDEGLAARSRLYFALALAQKRQLRKSRYIVRSVAEFARDTKDVRLARMCLGVWAKLRYLRSQCVKN